MRWLLMAALVLLLGCSEHPVATGIPPAGSVIRFRHPIIVVLEHQTGTETFIVWEEYERWLP